MTDVETLVLTVPAPPVVNRAPGAVDDRRSTPAGTAVLVTVLGNDSDADGDALTVTGSTQPATGGTVSCTATGCTFTPAAGFTGTTTFT